MRIFSTALLLAFVTSPQSLLAAVQEPVVSDPSVRPNAQTLPVITDDNSLYQTFGERQGLKEIMDDVMVRWLANPRTRPFFQAADQERLKGQLVDQFCVILKGPCTYTGRTMAEAHMGMNVNEGSFYALVEELQKTLNARKIPFRAQNRLLAALAPMHRDIIDK